MIRRLPMILSLVAMAVLAVAPATMSQDKLEGTMDLAWNECYPGAPNQEVPDWVGTVDFGGDVYDIIFWNVGTGWPNGHTPAAPFSPFNEVWAVYDGLELVFDDACAMTSLDGNLVLWGHDAGLLDTETLGYQMTGTVMEAMDAFDGHAGDGITMSGVVVFNDDGTPQTAPGDFIIG